MGAPRLKDPSREGPALMLARRIAPLHKSSSVLHRLLLVHLPSDNVQNLKLCRTEFIEYCYPNERNIPKSIRVFSDDSPT